jgi:hypothetical protein
MVLQWYVYSVYKMYVYYMGVCVGCICVYGGVCVGGVYMGLYVGGGGVWYGG